MAHRIPFVFCVLCTLAACVSEDNGDLVLTVDATPQETSPDARPLSVDAGARICFEPSIDVDVTMTVQIQDSCAIWNSLSTIGGEATIQKDANLLSIDFAGGVVFSGLMTDNQVALNYVHQHTFSDDCVWQATESMTGTVDPESCALTLSYDYSEAVAVSDGSCATPCSAAANVDLMITPIEID